MNYVYLLRCSDDSLYCGWTTDLEHRIEAHNNGSGAKYTRSRLPVKLVYYEEYEDRSQALRRESQIKKMNREEKLRLIKAQTNKAYLEKVISEIDSGKAILAEHALIED